MRKMLMAGACAAAMMAGAVAPAQSYERWLDIHNNTGTDLCYVYISHVDTRRWGPDLLGDECISPGDYARVDPGYQRGYCMMDLKFEFDDEDVVYGGPIDICTATDYYVY